MTVVVDTNVLLIANRRHEDVSDECVEVCAQRLLAIKKNGVIAIDDGYRILREYLGKTHPNGPKGPGDVFLKWLLQNQRNPERCCTVAITETHPDNFAEFPVDPVLVNFDPPDRKFVAVAAAHPDRPPLLQGADSKWLGWQPALRCNGIEVEFICEADIRRFQTNKKRKKIRER